MNSASRSPLAQALFEPQAIALVGASADLAKNNSRPQRFLKQHNKTFLNVDSAVGRVQKHDVIKGLLPILLSQLVVLSLLISFHDIVKVQLKFLLP